MNNTCKQIRRNILEMVTKSHSSHIGSCYSIVEILYVLYFEVMNIDPEKPDLSSRDKFILSKAHGSAALYSTLAERGFIKREDLERYYADDGLLPGHLDKERVRGLETSGGSLGHGLSIGAGMALANKIDNNPGNIYVLLGDGECNEGSVWEAVMFSSTHKLDNLTAVVDFNKLQSFGRTNEVINQSNMAERWESFGWEVIELDGNNCEDLIKAFNKESSKPKVIVANTVKGKGLSFIEDKLEWHYKSPNEDEYKKALLELK